MLVKQKMLNRCFSSEKCLGYPASQDFDCTTLDSLQHVFLEFLCAGLLGIGSERRFKNMFLDSFIQ